MAAIVGGTTQKNMLLIPLLDPADVGWRHCPLHPERLIANQELVHASHVIFQNITCIVILDLEPQKGIYKSNDSRADRLGTVCPIKRLALKVMPYV